MTGMFVKVAVVGIGVEVVGASTCGVFMLTLVSRLTGELAAAGTHVRIACLIGDLAIAGTLVGAIGTDTAGCEMWSNDDLSTSVNTHQLHLG